MSHERVTAAVDEHLAVVGGLHGLAAEIATAGAWAVETLARGNKILFFGNGGSAADAQHLAAELVGRFRTDRAALSGIALTTDSSVLTALANDFGVEAIFSRQVEALGAAGDLAFALSTSGGSPNVIAGVRAARERGLRTIGLTGEGGGALAPECDLALTIASRDTARVQEAHILIGHVVCQLAEEALAT